MSDQNPPDEKLPPLAVGIRRAREAKDWTQEDLAEAIGMTPNGVWMIEVGRSHPRRKTLDAITQALGRSESDLLALGEASDINPPGLQAMLDLGLASPPPDKDELEELRGIKWRGSPDGHAFLFALQAIRRANR